MAELGDEALRDVSGALDFENVDLHCKECGGEMVYRSDGFIYPVWQCTKCQRTIWYDGVLYGTDNEYHTVSGTF